MRKKLNSATARVGIPESVLLLDRHYSTMPSEETKVCLQFLDLVLAQYPEKPCRSVLFALST